MFTMLCVNQYVNCRCTCSYSMLRHVINTRFKCVVLRVYFRIAQRRDASVTKEVSMELDSNKKLTRQEKDERLKWISSSLNVFYLSQYIQLTLSMIQTSKANHGKFELLAIFTLEDKQIVWIDKSSGIWPSDVNFCHTVVNLFVSTGKSSWKNCLSRWPNIRRFVCWQNCSSHLYIRGFVRLRRFVYPDVLFILSYENGHWGIVLLGDKNEWLKLLEVELPWFSSIRFISKKEY